LIRGLRHIVPLTSLRGHAVPLDPLRGAVLLCILLTVVATSCGSNSTDIDTSNPSDLQQATLIERGEVAYKIYCIGCHGEAGDGLGDAAVFLNPKPRNFQVANFKFSSTRAGQLPTDEDLRHTILQGLKGSAMPSFPLLSRQTINALISYVKTFSPKWKDRSPATAIPIVDDPYRSMKDKSQAIARGEAVYHGFATCWTCHPTYVDQDRINVHLTTMENPTRDRFRNGLFESEGKMNSENELIYPPDFRRDFVRASADIFVLYRSISAGITGTAMPTWVDSFEIASEKNPNDMLITRADLWAMAYYVQDLIKQRPVKYAQSEVKVRNRPRAAGFKALRARPIYLHGAPPVEVTPESEIAEEKAEEFFDDE